MGCKGHPFHTSSMPQSSLQVRLESTLEVWKQLSGGSNVAHLLLTCHVPVLQSHCICPALPRLPFLRACPDLVPAPSSVPGSIRLIPQAPIGFCEETYQAESATADRNWCLGYMMKAGALLCLDMIEVECCKLTVPAASAPSSHGVSPASGPPTIIDVMPYYSNCPFASCRRARPSLHASRSSTTTRRMH